jgi:large subunit ribosomal protein L4
VSSIKMKKADGGSGASVDLPEAIFGIEPNVAVMHQVVTAQLAAKRAGTHSTKTRAEVRGGGAKPWRQKGTGRARQGSIRAPQWRGGGVAHGPHPRDYSQRTPKKMIRLALRSALSDRAAEGKLIVVDDWGVTEPKTKSGVKLLVSLGLRNVPRPAAESTDAEKPKRSYGGFHRNPRVLLVLFREEQAVWKSLRNLGERVQILLPEELNTYDVLLNDWLVFSKASLDATVARLSDADAEFSGAEVDETDELDTDDDATEADSTASEAS